MAEHPDGPTDAVLSPFACSVSASLGFLLKPQILDINKSAAAEEQLQISLMITTEATGELEGEPVSYQLDPDLKLLQPDMKHTQGPAQTQTSVCLSSGSF